MMRMLSNKQIKFYLKMTESKSIRKRNKAYSILRKDLDKFGAYRVELCKKMLIELMRGKRIEDSVSRK